MDNIEVQLENLNNKLENQKNEQQKKQIRDLIETLKKEQNNLICPEQKMSLPITFNLNDDQSDSGDTADNIQERIATQQNLCQELQSRDCSVYNDLYLENYLQSINQLKQPKQIKMTGKFTVSKGLYVQMKKYQQVGFQWILKHYLQYQSCLLCDEPGLGKTVQAIAFVESILNNDENQAIIIIAPITIALQWVNMFHRFSPFIRAILVNSHSAQLLNNKSYVQLFEMLSKQHNQHRYKSVYIMSYDFIRLNVDQLNIGFIKQICYQKQAPILICDEIHLLKNSHSDRFIQINQIKSIVKLGLTGTPIQNTYKELFQLFLFINPSILGQSKVFKTEFQDVIQKGSLKNATLSQIKEALTKARQLQSKISYYLLRRLKCNVECELPQKTEYLVSIQLSNQHQIYYKNLLDQSKQMFNFKQTHKQLQLIQDLRKVCIVPKQIQIGQNNKLKLLFTKIQEILQIDHFDSNKLKQILQYDCIIDGDDEYESEQCTQVYEDEEEEELSLQDDNNTQTKQQFIKTEKDNNFKVSMENSSFEEQFDETKNENNFSNKITQNYQDIDFEPNEETTQLLQQLENNQILYQKNKILIFSHYLSVINSLQHIFNQLNVNCLRIDGKTDIHQRFEIINKFQTDDQYQIILLSAQVGGLGLNLTAANYVFLLQPSWNPAVDTQAIERAWRIGQQRRVQIYRLIYGGTIEEKIVNRQDFKKQLMEKVLNNAFAQRTLNFNDIYSLFNYKQQEEEIKVKVVQDVCGAGQNNQFIVFQGIDEKLQKYL